ncbi:MAG: FAD-binding oxidoreductase [Phycisphaerales bacterium]|nr:FAD-binding oxidoreductase [Phycisphaerales bacterium]
MSNSLSRLTRRAFNRLLGRVAVAAPIVSATPALGRQSPTDAPNWPTDGDWGKLKVQVKGRLIKPESPLIACTGAHAKADAEACTAAIKSLSNPFYIEDQAGIAQTSGWLDAWEYKISPYAVAAETVEDIQHAVNFAREHKVRLVIKGTGHDYIGRNNAPDSLLVWTHAMRDVTSHASFVPQGAPEGTKGVPAVSAQAGARWLEGYTEVTTKNGRYVQGGGCTSVGMAGGFMQGGGFGSFSRRYGTGAASMLEAEVVTADGQVRVCNDHQDSDLFWALRGGGGSTFGIVTRVTLETHEAPSQSGFVNGTIKAKNDEAYLMLLQALAVSWRKNLTNERWGEHITFKDQSLEFGLTWSGLDESGAKAAFQEVFDEVAKHAAYFEVDFNVKAMPFRKAWDLPYIEETNPSRVHTDDRGGESAGQFWWAGDQIQVSWFIWEYFGRYMPADLLGDEVTFANLMFAATRHSTVYVHLNKGLYGASEEARRRTAETSINPKVLAAAGLFIIAGGQESAFPGVEGHAPDMNEAKAQRDRMKHAYDIIRSATPGAGSYVNESSYFDEDWQAQYWGDNYARLLAIKKKFDPTNMFTGHHLVGSEDA